MNQYERHGFNFTAVMNSGLVALRQYCELQIIQTQKTGRILVMKTPTGYIVIGRNADRFPGNCLYHYGMKLKRVVPDVKTCIAFTPYIDYALPDSKQPDTLLTFIL